jgi:hypothetical protein
MASRPHTKGLHIHLDSTKQEDVLRKLSIVENMLKQLETLKGNSSSTWHSFKQLETLKGND